MYIDQKNIVSDMIQTAKNNYFTEKVMECGKDQKALYRVIHRGCRQGWKFMAKSLTGSSPTSWTDVSQHVRVVQSLHPGMLPLVSHRDL